MGRNSRGSHPTGFLQAVAHSQYFFAARWTPLMLVECACMDRSNAVDVPVTVLKSKYHYFYLGSKTYLRPGFQRKKMSETYHRLVGPIFNIYRALRLLKTENVLK